MQRQLRKYLPVAILAALIMAAVPVLAHSHHGHHHHHHHRPFVANVIVPQARPHSIGRPAAVRMTLVEVKVTVDGQVATTQMDIYLENPSHQRQESELLMPVPDGAVVKSFSFKGSAKEDSAELLPADDARRIYDDIVSRMKDPALLQFVGFNLVRSSVFPLEPHGTQQVRLTYEHLLPSDGTRVDYVLPRTEALDYHVPWDITVDIDADDKLSTVYSPTHEIDTSRKGSDRAVIRVADGSRKQAGAFRLSYLLERDGVTGTVIAFPDKSVGGGYFLMLVGLPTRVERDEPIKREVTIVIDRSGSMAGEKLEQVKAAAKQVLYGLEDGEMFNVIVYNEFVDPYSTKPIEKSSDSVKEALIWLDEVQAAGGTNIHDALHQALEMESNGDHLPLVLFMTDGLPTIGETSERKIRKLVEGHNPHKRRVFTFGVGVDVNTPLLEAVADDSRGSATFVLPREDVEVKVAAVFRKLQGPIFSEPRFKVLDDKVEAPRRAREVMPRRLPDLFAGDQLIVLGQYRGKGELEFAVKGRYLGKSKTFRFKFNPRKAKKHNSFVPRLWAGRKIAGLVDEIRRAGADLTNPNDRRRVAQDPRFQELVDEIIRLSTRFGILTEYTAFLAREGTDLAKREAIFEEAHKNLVEKAVSTRSGWAAVSQSINNQRRARQATLNPANEFYDDEMNQVEVRGVQQVADKAFYRQGGRWVDSSLVNKKKADRAPAREVKFGSKEHLKIARELAEEGEAGSVAMDGDIILEFEDQPVLIRSGK